MFPPQKWAKAAASAAVGVNTLSPTDLTWAHFSTRWCCLTLSDEKDKITSMRVRVEFSFFSVLNCAENSGFLNSNFLHTHTKKDKLDIVR